MSSMDNGLHFTGKYDSRKRPIHVSRTAGAHWVQRLVRRFRPVAKAERKVMLVMYDGDMKIVTAHETQSGWVARWINNDDQWSRLLTDGRVEGTSLVRKWYPHSGWDGTEKIFPA